MPISQAVTYRIFCKVDIL